MKKIFLPGIHGTAQFGEAIAQLEKQEEIQSVLIFTAAKSALSKEACDPIITQTSLSITGGVFPEIIYNGKNYDEGTVLVGIQSIINSLMITDFSEGRDVSVDISNQFGDIDPNGMTAFIFVDALISQKPKLFDSLYNLYGTIPRYIGGGTGSLEFKPFPSIYSNEGMIQEGAIVGMCELESHIGVAHGYDTISDPLKVTESDGNRVISLNWRPALELYTEVVTGHSKQEFDYEDFFNSVKSYPFGIAKLDSEMVVRDPFKYEGTSIFTLDNVEQGSYVSILFGDKENLLTGADSAFIRSNFKHLSKQSSTLIIDCISRALFLGDDLNKELQLLDPDNKAFGAMTLGEIANNGDSYLEIFNKTAVVCSMYE